MRNPVVALLFLTASLLCAQGGWFQPSLLEKPDVRKALQSVDERASAIVDEWIRVVETPAPSGKEQARAKYIREELEKLGRHRPEGQARRRHSARAGRR
jgi:tripeptide aminopeptidase